MKTELATSYAEVLNADSLRQIAEWSETTHKVLLSTIRNKLDDGDSLSSVSDLRDDADAFFMMAATIRRIVGSN